MNETVPTEHILDISVDVEKTAGGGEDADPLLWRSLDGSRCVIGVFDGLGGAGSVLYGKPPQQHTGAYYASRRAREIALGLLMELPPSVEDRSPYILQELERRLRSGLKKSAEDLSHGGGAPRLKSTLIRTLPTTMALIHSNRQGKDMSCQVIWAGDSRAFHLHPTQGLQQLTRDDLVSGGDPLENLINDSPLSNYISADGNFRLNASSFSFQLPTILLVATDGCFGYVPTPFHFEHLLLESLHRAASPEDWQENLRRRFVDIAGDDASLSLIAIGWNKIEDVQWSFSKRFEVLEAEYIKVHDKLLSDLADLEKQVKKLSDERDRSKQNVQKSRQLAWDQYSKSYMYHLGEPTPAEPAGSAAETHGRKVDGRCEA